MALQHTETNHFFDIPHRILLGVGSVFSVIWSALVSVSEANRRVIIVQQLSEKSDAELAKLGIRREDIVQHVFVDRLDV